MSNGRPAVCGRPMGYVQPLRVSGATERHILAAYPSHSLDKEKERPKSLAELHFTIDKRRNDTEISVSVNPTKGPRTTFWDSFQGFLIQASKSRSNSTWVRSMTIFYSRFFHLSPDGDDRRDDLRRAKPPTPSARPGEACPARANIIHEHDHSVFHSVRAEPRRSNRPCAACSLTSTRADLRRFPPTTKEGCALPPTDIAHGIGKFAGVVDPAVPPPKERHRHRHEDRRINRRSKRRTCNDAKATAEHVQHFRPPPVLCCGKEHAEPGGVPS